MKTIRIDREEIALARVAHACGKAANREPGEVARVEEILSIVAPGKFSGQKEKRVLCREFLPGGEFGNRSYGSTLEELTEAATVIFTKLAPLAEEGFRKTGKPNVWADLASVAYGIAKQRRAA